VVHSTVNRKTDDALIAAVARGCLRALLPSLVSERNAKKTRRILRSVQMSLHWNLTLPRV
jgi:hypothetical protein